MPRYLIERVFDPTVEDEMDVIGAASKRIAVQKFPEILWEHSHVAIDDQGRPVSFCIYHAPNEEMIRAHAKELGHHEIGRIYEIGGDVSPDDFPL